ncbi:hypothetical protein Sste5346_004439 [Sporothrix stenoceras]|uniref:Integral membrane protein n=1 Tax=Sporothrix stenoceras TaxID=5173 RepID=A0ABR3Z808_9PEZI
MAANCSVVPSSTPSNSGIAGAGVLLSFIITAAVALSISAALVFSDTWGRAAQQRKASGGSSTPTSSFAIIGRKLLNSYSDQQIVTGIGIQSLGLSQINSLVPYHFFLIWMLGLLSTAVHNAALLALVHDFRRDWVLRWLRQALMFVNLALSCIYGIFVLRELAAGLPQTLPMACALESGVSKNTTVSTGDKSEDTTAAWSGSAGAFQFIATVAVVAGNCIVFILSTWYLHSRAQRFYRIVQIIGLALMAAVAIGVAVRIVLLSQAFGHPSVALSDNGETQWSFGQLLSLLMLLLPLISVVEIARGEIKVAPPVQDDGKGGSSSGDTMPLVEHQLPMGKAGHASFQPTPFMSRRTKSGR